AAASAIYGMLRQTTQHEIGVLLPLIKPDQGFGQFINQHHFAFLMEMGFGLALGIIVGGGVRRELALVYFAALLPIWTALVLSNSRGGLLAMMVQLTVGWLLFTRVVPAWGSKTAPRVLRLIRSLPVRMLLLVVLLGGAIAGTVWIGGDRLVGRIEGAHEAADPADVSRNEIWKATWKMFQAHPVAGVGMGGYWIAIHQHHDASGVLAPQEAHNDYLEVLASGGVIGAALLIWFVIVLFRQARANLRSANQFQRAACFGAILGLVGIGFHSFFDFGLHMIANALICTALVVIATNKWSNKKYKAADV
ncbi:MAG: O-antigen ligase family protein, partial [Pyrinomonadaceae bacterium]